MKDDVVVITGAGRGIGREIALGFANEGAIVAICARTQEGIKAVEKEIGERGGRVLASLCDVGNEREVEGFINRVSEISGRIDVLVNNAGVAFLAPVAELDSSRWEETIRINLTGVFLVTKYALRFMGEGSHIFNIASNAARTGFPNWSAYCASKFGLLGFTDSIREELRGKGIKVTAIIPGPTDTPLWDGIPGSWDRRRMIKPHDVAKMVLAVYKQPKETLTEEVVILPLGGAF
ncbi:MAG TPA: SDR family oxidoreductase [Thermodesulfobacteriota bacterium]|jgi:NAD(P)-dependent dehydrogenase (short-subunit alcohol dehydrogenase family)|nr:SDR family oxidoreductase [Thermodesulfobacteriota bacterium]